MAWKLGQLTEKTERANLPKLVKSGNDSPHKSAAQRREMSFSRNFCKFSLG